MPISLIVLTIIGIGIGIVALSGIFFAFYFRYRKSIIDEYKLDVRKLQIDIDIKKREYRIRRFIIDEEEEIVNEQQNDFLPLERLVEHVDTLEPKPWFVPTLKKI